MMMPRPVIVRHLDLLHGKGGADDDAKACYCQASLLSLHGNLNNRSYVLRLRGTIV